MTKKLPVLKLPGFFGKLLILTLILIVLLTIVLSIFKFASSDKQIILQTAFSKTQYYNFEPISFSYSIFNPGNKKHDDLNLRVLFCNQAKTSCEEVLAKKLSQLGAGGTLNSVETFVNEKNMNDFGFKSLIIMIYSSSDPEGSLAESVQEINYKNLSQNMFLNLSTDTTFYSTNDLAKLTYSFKNQSDMKLDKEHFSLSLNFAGPLEQAAGGGRVIKDLSKDFTPGQMESGKENWALVEYPNRVGGIYQVSLYLAYKKNDGSEVKVADVVRQIQWP